MAAFYLMPANLQGSEYESKLRKVFECRGFSNALTIRKDEYVLVAYPKLGMDKIQAWQDNSGNVLFVCGTLFYKSKLVAGEASQLMQDIAANKVAASDFKGTYLAISYQAANSSWQLFHDTKGIYRFYADAKRQVISSSFYALAKSADGVDLNKESISFNLLFGFLPSTETWVSGIERVLSQSNLPEKISYTRLRSNAQAALHYRTFEEACNGSSNKLTELFEKNFSGLNLDCFLGLSSGYDSRLVASAVHQFENLKLNYFTFHKPGASDPVAATAIASLAGKTLIKKETYRPKTYEEQQAVYNDAFNFFDAQAVTMMQYSKPDYAAQFRREVLGTNSFHLSGVGGELFRNYNHDHQLTTSVDAWMKSLLLAGFDIDHFISTNSSDLRDKFHTYIKSELGVTKNINYADRKRYYGEVFLRDWHGVRNSIENQFSFYFTPFTDHELIQASYDTIRFHGYGGIFEGSMINALWPAAGAIPSGYGHALNNYPASVAVMNKIRAFSKIPALSAIRKKPAGKTYQPTKFEQEQLAVFQKIELPIKLDHFLQSSTRVEPLLSTAYALNKLINE